MSLLKDYADKYECAMLRREDGILEVTFHTDGGPLVWGAGPHNQIQELFGDIARDRENSVVILTAAGDQFIGGIDAASLSHIGTPEGWDNIYWEGKRMLQNLLDIEVPVIGAINGPAREHSELFLLSDVVIAADTTVIQDVPHFINGLVPGDGVNLIFPLLLGWNRGRYFLLTGQEIDAQEALNLGLVNEVVPRDRLVARAWELARQLARQPRLTLRYTRVMFTQPLKKMILSDLGYGLALEGSAYMAIARPDHEFLPDS
jgi:enoyl-CoA hydratase/carnithine racemase